uniref:choice-of-anchor Q domain-containing protein n=1 Tax=Candidatus Electronema sp. TaxID=2698783 RepID=UPI0040576DA4
MKKQRYWLLAALSLSLTAQTAHSASITVDAGGICTLADAITAANTDMAEGGCPSGSGADIITLMTDVTLTAALPDIISTVTIEGSGHFISGNNDSAVGSVLRITDTGNLTLNETTVKNGSAGINNGGGIYNSGTVTLNNVTISGNSANQGGGIYNYTNGTVTLTNSTVSGNSGVTLNSDWYGAGIANRGTITLTNSTVSGNLAHYGGGICNGGGIVTLTNSTVSGNNCYVLGGGIYNMSGTATLIDSTVSGNTAGYGRTDGYGGGICNGGDTVTLHSSIISGNFASSGKEVYKFSGTTITAVGYNIFGHSDETSAQAFDGFTPGGSDVTATSDGTQPTVLADILLPLADNGGPTQTHALPAGSPAVDLDAACNTGLSTDQRGYCRKFGAGCDAGSFELSDACGCDRALPANTWLMTAPACQPADPPGISAQYGPNIPGGAAAYNTSWVGYMWNAETQSYPPKMAAADPLALSFGNWLYSTSAGAVRMTSGTATPTTDCSGYGLGQCFEIEIVIAPAGQNRWNFIGHPFPYAVNWADVKVALSHNGGATWEVYSPSQAESAGYVSKVFHRWNGNGYDPYDDSTPGQTGTLQPQEAVWVRSIGSYAAAP